MVIFRLFAHAISIFTSTLFQLTKKHARNASTWKCHANKDDKKGSVIPNVNFN